MYSKSVIKNIYYSKQVSSQQKHQEHELQKKIKYPNNNYIKYDLQWLDTIDKALEDIQVKEEDLNMDQLKDLLQKMPFINVSHNARNFSENKKSQVEVDDSSHKRYIKDVLQQIKKQLLIKLLPQGPETAQGQAQ